MPRGVRRFDRYVRLIKAQIVAIETSDESFSFFSLNDLFFPVVLPFIMIFFPLARCRAVATHNAPARFVQVYAAVRLFFHPLKITSSFSFFSFLFLDRV